MVLGARQQVKIWKTGQLSRHYIAEISLNVTLNNNQPTNQKANDIHVYKPNLWMTTCLRGTGTSKDVFNLLAIRGPTRGEGKPGIEPGSSDPQSSPLPLHHRGGLNVVGNGYYSDC